MFLEVDPSSMKYIIPDAETCTLSLESDPENVVPQKSKSKSSGRSKLPAQLFW